MSKARSVDRFFSGVEWKWSLATMLWGVPAAIASFALPAWAVNASRIFEAYAPVSWVAAGFIGLFSASITYAVTAWARGKWVRARYDARMLAMGGAIDALEKTFERKRIYLNEFCLASHPYVEDKIFIDCEIIGPANIIFVEGNNITEARYPICDAVFMNNGAQYNNGYLFRNCVFRRCNFTRITFLVPYTEYGMFTGFQFVRWITEFPNYQPELPLNKTGELQTLVESSGPESET